MTLRVQPAWAVHLQPGSEIPLQDEAARRYLRRGSLPEALLRDGGRPALVAGEMENSGAWIVAYLGLQLLGATVVGMNPAFKAAEAEQILSDSEAAVALVDAGRQSLIDALRPRLKALHQTARVEEIGSVPSPPASPSPSPLVGAGWGGGSLTPEDPALLLYTSGTTGRPKGALLDHGNLLAQGRGVVEAWRWTAEDRLVLALPLFHVESLISFGNVSTGSPDSVKPFTLARA